MQYDVFISCKHEDYKYAEEIYEFLEANGIHTFLASKELRTLGDSEYRRGISAAMKSTYHMVVFASNAEYVDSTWVYYEWDMFINAKLKGYKSGQIVTILKDVNVDDINMDLWKYESFTFDNYKEKLLSYAETPSSQKRREEARKKQEELEHTKRKQEEQLKKQQEAKELLITLAKEYRRKVADLNSIDAKEIVVNLRSSGVSAHVCPVCTTEVDVARSYCPTCGWTISPIDNIEGAEYLSLVNEKQLEVARGIYCKYAKLEDELKQIADISKEKETLEAKVVELTAQVIRLEEQINAIKVPSSQTNNASEPQVKNKDSKWWEALNAIAASFGTYASELQTKIVDFKKKTYTVNGVSFTMIDVEGGTFTMGTTRKLDGNAGSDEKPTHEVTLSNYSIGETEVTQELWQAVMGSNPSRFTGDMQLPVEQVSWNDCQTFIKKLNQLTGENFRLPTEAEWEYAARGGKESKGYKYSGSNTLGDVAWSDSNSSSTTHTVKTKQPNELGLYDMSGNVWEWCSDWYGSYSSFAQTNPTGPSFGFCRVLRGGSWRSNARSCRVVCRHDYSPDGRGIHNGLRLVR